MSDKKTKTPSPDKFVPQPLPDEEKKTETSSTLTEKKTSSLNSLDALVLSELIEICFQKGGIITPDSAAIISQIYQKLKPSALAAKEAIAKQRESK